MPLTPHGTTTTRWIPRRMASSTATTTAATSFVTKMTTTPTTMTIPTTTASWRRDHRTMTKHRTWPPACEGLASTELRSPRLRNRRQRRLSHRHSSSASHDDDDGDDRMNLGPMRLQDHLDELGSVPLSDVRNFCIIAHVVSIHNDYLLNCFYFVPRVVSAERKRIHHPT